MPWCVCETCPPTAHRRTLMICHSQQRRLSPTRCESMWNLGATITECIFWCKGVQPMWTSCWGSQSYRDMRGRSIEHTCSVFVRVSEVPSLFPYSARQEELVELPQWPTRGSRVFVNCLQACLLVSSWRDLVNLLDPTLSCVQSRRV